MSAWRAIFLAEIRRVLPLLPLVLVLQGLMICVRIERGIDLSPRLAALIEWGTWALAGGIVVTSLWMDSPSRRERLLATRPVKPLALYSAKFAALFALAGLPFVAVEFGNLLAWGWSGSSVLLGTLQMLVAVLVLLLAAFPLVWLWRGKISGVIGTVLVYLVAERTMSKLGSLQYHSFAIVLHPSATLLFIGTLALLLLGLIMIPGRLRHPLKTLLFLPAASLATFVTAWTCTPDRGSIERGETVPLVQLHFTPQPRQDGYTETFNVRFPVPEAPADVEVDWHLTRLEANGKNFAGATSDDRVAGGHYGLRSPAMQKVLRARYGTGVRLPEPKIEAKPWPGGTLIDARDEAGHLDLDLTARRILFGFEVAGELPFKPGASLRQGDLLWTVGAGQGNPGSGGDPFASLCLRTPYLWLGSLEPESDVAYHLFILEPSGKIQKMGSWYFGPRGPRGAGKLRRFTARLSELGIASEAEWPTDARLVIVRAAVISGTSYSWKSPEPLKAPSDHGGRYPQVPDPGPEAILPWLKQHPVPPATAGGDEVSTWLAEMLPRIRLTPPPRNSEDPGFEAAIAAVATLVPAHPDRVHQALEDLPDSRNGAQNVCWEAFIRSLQRDAVKRFPELMGDGFIRHQYVRKGWAADVIPYEVTQVRMGVNPSSIDVLLADPQATGLSQDEWLTLFRVSPHGHVFQALNGKVVAKPLLEAEADRILAAWTPPAPGEFSSQHHLLINLALARGRSDAPRWLALYIERWRAAGRPNLARGLGLTLATYFILPESASSDQAAIEWFMSQDPAAFVFDPATGKYHLP